MNWPGLIRHYRSRLPVSDATPVVTLLEGSTPLIPAPRIAGLIGGNITLYLKYEGLNPTCSFKDRGMTMAVSKARERGAEVVVCASTGNTSASASAYAASAGLKCAVILPHGNIAMGKLAQAIMYGASIVPISGNFDDALRLVRELASRPEVEIVNSINPVRIEGQKTAAFEICDVLGRAPDFHFLPVGNAGNITAYWRGFTEYKRDGITSATPKMCGYQAAGSAPIVLGEPVLKPQTVASAIRIGNPASWKQAVAAAQESEGWIDSVTDEEILEAYRLIARMEGVFVEPASAAGVAGLIKAHGAGKIPEGSVITATLTGHGLKDPDNALKQAPAFSPVEPTLDAVLRTLGM
ncbi:threonine synthase [Verrucomicrobia bacterium LW23]|nr:threonine synthase [Verrucomicrobia bacterium LW23]